MEQQFPTEMVTLPSKGLLYPEGSPLKKGEIEMKYMTAREEDILTNQNLIENGTVIDKLLQSLIVTPINYGDLLIGDKNAILVAARILGYGKDYEFEYNGEKIEVDLTTISDKPLNESISKNGKNEFTFNKNSSAELSTRMKHIITSINGDYEKSTVREFVDIKLLARDSRALRNNIVDLQPDVELTFDYENKNGDFVKIPVPINLNFFWPDA